MCFYHYSAPFHSTPQSSYTDNGVIILNPCELVTLISSLACAISKTFSAEEISILAAVFTQLGDSLATILAAGKLCGREDED